MSFPEAWRYEIFSNVTFNYPSDDWTLWNDHCEEYWTLIERNWTIPKDLDLKSGKFAIIFRNETDPANRTSILSDLFFIQNNETSTSTAAPTQTVTVTIATPEATNGGPETTESTPAPTNDGGLSSGVKTCISVGVAALTTLLLLGL
ncbi:hypothetical protein CEP53_006218 [Fusarium sp. AF-6]|nr:hypothetical protein CEP53_006218 [Fusarium sp. AF-6]